MNTYKWICNHSTVGEWPWFEHKGKTYDKKTFKEVKRKSIPLKEWLNDWIEKKIKEANE